MRGALSARQGPVHKVLARRADVAAEPREIRTWCARGVAGSEAEATIDAMARDRFH